MIRNNSKRRSYGAARGHAPSRSVVSCMFRWRKWIGGKMRRITVSPRTSNTPLPTICVGFFEVSPSQKQVSAGRTRTSRRYIRARPAWPVSAAHRRPPRQEASSFIAEITPTPYNEDENDEPTHDKLWRISWISIHSFATVHNDYLNIILYNTDETHSLTTWWERPRFSCENIIYYDNNIIVSY